VDIMPTAPAAQPNRTIISQLCSVCVRETGVDGGGVSMLSEGRMSVKLHTTDDLAALIEDLQFVLGEGPCVDAAASGGPILVADLSDPREAVSQRWPIFIDEARNAGVRAVFAFPIRTGAIGLGTLDLYRRAPGPLDTAQLAAGLSTVDSLGQWLLDREAPSLDLEPNSMLVHQAAGMAMVQLGSTIEEAMLRLRSSAYSEGVSITQLAGDVVRGSRRFEKEGDQ
jgi:GAF domain-containing protein